MNYYIQGDAANADKIKAAFEKRGIDVLGFVFADKTVLYCSIGGCVQYLPYSINLMHILYCHPDYKELELPIEPKFKVGDWVATDYGKVSQVVSVDNDGDGYTLDDGVYFSCSWCDMYHLWTIQDAKDGDVLVTTTIRNCPFIYDKSRHYNNGLVYYYAGIDGNGKFVMKERATMLSYFGSINDVIPATKEQRDLLFAKMKEAGYQWDADKKELRKIQPHSAIANFKPFDKVLVRDCNHNVWRCGWFSHYNEKEVGYPFVVTCNTYKQCIPFEGNEHLLGTTDPCDERYINW